MALRDLLVHVDSTDLAAKRLRVAVELARLHGARLTGMFAEDVSIGPSIVGRRDPDQIAKAAARARDLFESHASAAGIPSGFWTVDARDDAELTDWVVRCCRYVDLSVFGGPAGDGDRIPDGLVEEVVLESGRPVLAIPPRMPLGRIGENVLVAWTGSRAAVRAVNDAIPLLHSAREVTVLSLQLPSTGASGGPAPELDIAAHLKAHGISARYERFIVGELGPVDHVLNRTTDLGADLVVMGAHRGRGLAHARHEDTTAELLHSMTAPVLLSH
jgi:nucleotide-binding universal stress UspA family protein